VKITLPYPPAKLSPNKRLHWAARAQIVAKYRADCFAVTLTVKNHGLQGDERRLSPRPLPIKITFHPPDRRRRDRDNMIAAFKAGADGVADAIGVDDADWSPTYAVGEPVKGGCVIIEIGGET
jgi:crossover junction endodeoxyribonuclease RusA